jgi:hypothetical protein
VESDPIGVYGGSFSTYAYASGDPLSRFDEEGLEDKKPEIPGGHDNNQRESNRERHEQGDSRRQRDQHGGEKGDGKRRMPTKRPPGYKKGPWPPKPKAPVGTPALPFILNPCLWAPELMPPGYCYPGPASC